MDLLLLFILAAIAGTAAVGGVILWSTQRAASAAITSYFKASEYILDTREPPPEWLAKPKRRLMTRTERSHDSKADLLGRLDDLIRFFEGCQFFEDAWTREQMLAQLAAIREDWRQRGIA